MGCNCGKKGPVRRMPAFRPITNASKPKAVPFSTPSPAQLRALGMQTSTNLAESRQMDANRRRVEKLRRAAIKNKLNK
jgi:hypothetical protein